MARPQVGKLLIFRSGAVKLQMGEVLLDVSLGSKCGFRQDVAATHNTNATSGHFLQLGKLEARLVASPDIRQLLKYAHCPRKLSRFAIRSQQFTHLPSTISRFAIRSLQFAQNCTLYNLMRTGYSGVPSAMWPLSGLCWI